MNKRLAVCVPYRNRKDHLIKFVPYLTDFLNKHLIQHKIFICHQNDNKPFNRGKLLNIAFKTACEEGYDYFAFHDIDLLPEDDSCDYSYPEEYPVHLAVKRSEDNYKLPYPEYFSGCVLFTKKQFETINGYYNDYWGWGWEDDDLFYRVKKKGFADIRYLTENVINRSVVNLTGKKSYIEIESNNFDKSIDKNGFSLMLLVKPEKKPEEYLLGDKYSYFEVPIFSSGNKNIISHMMYEEYAAHLTNRLGVGNFLSKRSIKNEWTLLFLIVDRIKKEVSFFVNGIEASLIIQKSYHTYESRKIIGYPIIIGSKKKFSLANIINKDFKGQIAELCLWNKIFDKKEMLEQISNIEHELCREKMVLYYDFRQVNNNRIYDKSGNNNYGLMTNCSITKENIEGIKKYCHPYRRNGKFECLPHKKSLKKLFWIGLPKQSRISAQNERIFNLEVQTGKINTDNNGLNNLKYILINKEKIFDNHEMINVEC